MAKFLKQFKVYVPIRKLATVLLGAGLTWGAQRLGLDLGSAAANQAAPVIVGAVLGYLERDPRVKEIIEAVDPAEATVAPKQPA